MDIKNYCKSYQFGLQVLGLLLVQIILYQALFSSGFVFDDRFLIVQNQHLSWSSIWFSDLWMADKSQSGFYRPIFLSTIYLDKQFSDHFSLGYHIHNLIWHLANIVIFSQLLKFKEQRRKLTWLALLCFSFQPLLSEGVFWVSARNDTMALFFVLTSVFCIEKQKIKTAALLFLMGLLCKETTLALFGSLFLLKKYRTKQIIFSFGISFLLWAGWRSALSIGAPPINIERYIEGISLFPFVLMDMLSRLWWPWPLSAAKPIAWLELEWWNYFFAGLSVWLGMRHFQKYKEDRLWLLISVFSLLLIFPPVVHTGIYGDRYWTVAMVGWALVIGRLGYSLLMGIFILLWSWLIWARGPDYQSDLHFWQSEYQHLPTPFSAVSLAHIEYEKGFKKEAYHHYQEAYQASTPYFMGMESFLACSLKLFGPQKMLEDAMFLQRNNVELSGEALGLIAVSQAALANWDEVDIILKMDIQDVTRRLDVVRALVALRTGNTDDYCTIYDSWSDSALLEKQIQSISPQQPLFNCQ